MNTSTRQKFLYCLVFLSIIPIILVGIIIVQQVPSHITADDSLVFKMVGIEARQHSLTFDEEIALIRKTQAKVFSIAPLLPGDLGLPLGEAREPKDLMIKEKHGLCYDRSRSIDKALKYQGFEVRHGYILYKTNKNDNFLSTFFTRGTPSHAITEVKTSRGWMLIDSNQEWISLTMHSTPLEAKDLWRHKNEFSEIPSYLAYPYWYIGGMYSRKGGLYGSLLIGPEINIHDFVYWILNR